MFKISNKCCDWVKKNLAHSIVRGGGYDLSCVGIRKAEGGIRAASHKNCFSQGDGNNEFRPVFWLRDSDKEEYCNHYNVDHSACYSEYGLVRTGCFGCPFGKRFEEELEAISRYEPKLHKAAEHIFADSYEYTRQYLKFREEMKAKKEAIH
jgi:3'-phosphoadenosine 5'-phosphosulfate sulfotransferase (PAPS reductase)/FAD synthetase